MLNLYIEKNISSRELLKKVFSDYEIEEDILLNEFGKPYIKSNKIYFNISHSKEYTVCAVSDKNIGVDIQYITYKPRVIKRYYLESEQVLACNADEFTKIWVMKESYAKWLGKGLSYGLLNIDTTRIEGFNIIKHEDYYICVYEKTS